jgi:hypothetical protein
MGDANPLVAEIGEPPAPEREGQALPRDPSREQMMRREAGLTLQARMDLFEALSSDAAWARSAVRVR